jgi:hypothetical protein
MADQLIALRNVLEELHKLIQDQSGSRLDLKQLDGPLARCKTDLDDLEAKLKPKGWKASLMWPLKERDMKKTIDNLSGIRDSVSVVLQGIHMYVWYHCACNILMDWI